MGRNKKTNSKPLTPTVELKFNTQNEGAGCDGCFFDDKKNNCCYLENKMSTKEIVDICYKHQVVFKLEDWRMSH
uniref:Uncharacterized protein n=1 Tax=viral metagenome TaxID=1070528 RepID=A0A6H1ZZB3_9ZZZZ